MANKQRALVLSAQVRSPKPYIGLLSFLKISSKPVPSFTGLLSENRFLGGMGVMTKIFLRIVDITRVVNEGGFQDRVFLGQSITEINTIPGPGSELSLGSFSKRDL